MRTAVLQLMAHAWNELPWEKMDVLVVAIISAVFVVIGWILFIVINSLSPFLRPFWKLVRMLAYIGKPVIMAIIATS